MTDGDLPFLDKEGMDEGEAVEAVAAEPEPEPKGEPEAAPPAAVVEDNARHIPISALLDEREKRQKLEREAEELRKWRAEQEAKQQKRPDFYADPEGFLAQQQQLVQQALWNERLNTSEIVAREKFGDEAVEKAAEAFRAAAQNSPALAAEFRRQANPYSYVIAWHKKQSTLEKMGDDPDAWINAQIEARLAERMAQMSQPVQSKPSAPPPSLASAAAAGGTKEPPASGFSAMFGD